MNLFDVYKLWPIEPVKGEGCTIYDRDGVEYLDMYGGHAVISIGHSHPYYTGMIKDQLNNLAFYSNSVQNPLQRKLAYDLGKMCGYEEYSLFLSNSGAEANENAIKLASFHTGKSKVLAFKGSFHGRTSGAVAVTDNPLLSSPFNSSRKVKFVALGDLDAVKREFSSGEYAAVIIEGIQGVAGIVDPGNLFLKELKKIAKKSGVVLIIDEVQSGYGRTGKFFAHQYSGVKADIVTVAKGMANGFPIGGTIISPSFTAISGMLGTTFGGNHLACAAAIAVLDVIRDEELVMMAYEKGKYLLDKLGSLKKRLGNGVITEIRGKGLMIGIEMDEGFIPVRNALLFEEKIFTGGAKSNIIRLLPPLTISREQLDHFLVSFENAIEKHKTRVGS
ncbi:MAG: aminotransferase class III-fold pyridoxal phosphate-dependent enzyme [Bacteroidales bacterium]|jgi:acetylornithine aminotransferase|nr:aminotransferase class III-fold pyridoxal phosphate-dependent enzyme [Bacteroidales bacterium]MDD3844304.1 aminotransferase class III-fold pyridoxal phosphate-dependent enzyme [Bacteroidales bacterium]